MATGRREQVWACQIVKITAHLCLSVVHDVAAKFDRPFQTESESDVKQSFLYKYYSHVPYFFTFGEKEHFVLQNRNLNMFE